MAGRRSKNKGKRGEREVATLFREALSDLGLDVRRGWQSRNGGSDEPDVIVPEELALHVEVKRHKRCNARAALKQAIADAKPGLTPVAFCRDDADGKVADRMPPFVVLRQEDFVDMVVEWFKLKQGG